MDRLASSQVVALLVAVAILLGCARLLGELARRLGQPMVLGEILAGVLLGPTLLGRLAPELFAVLFPATGAQAIAQDAFSLLAIVLFLLVAGMEVDLSSVWRQGKLALWVSTAGMVVPFALGFVLALAAPGLIHKPAGVEGLVYALFFATALSISALPVIAKTLMDLGLLRTDLGVLVIAAAVFNDLVGWIVFALVLSMIGGHDHAHSIGTTVWLTLGFSFGMLTLGRWFVHRLLPYLQAHLSYPGGVISISLALALCAAAFTEWVGVHAIFGAFLFGVALGDSTHLKEQTRATLDRFISFFFAPLFFASIGLRVDFVGSFDLSLVIIVLVIACIGKVLGCGFAARYAGQRWRQAFAVGFGLNARGAMEIILGLLALEAGVIAEDMFVALVIMALVTSMMSGPAMQLLLRQGRKAIRFSNVISPKAYVRPLVATDSADAIRQLAAALNTAHGLDAEVIAAAAIRREQLFTTGMAHGIALPHARIPDCPRISVAVGISEKGVDFNSPDGLPARLILLIVTPREDDGAHLEILADIAQKLTEPEAVAECLKTRDFTELLAWLRIQEGSPSHPTPTGMAGAREGA